MTVVLFSVFAIYLKLENKSFSSLFIFSLLNEQMIPQGIITAYNPTGVKSAIKKISTEKIIQSGLILSLSNKK